MWLNRIDGGRWRVEFKADPEAVQAHIPGATLDLDAGTVLLDTLRPALRRLDFQSLAMGTAAKLLIGLPDREIWLQMGVVRGIERLD